MLRCFVPIVLLTLFAGAPINVLAAEKIEKLFSDGNAKFDAGEYAAAIEVYNSILEQEPKADNVLVRRAIAKHSLKDVSGARADLAQAISLNPQHPDAYRVRAMIRYQANDLTGILADVDKAVQYDPENALVHAMRGEIRAELGNLTEALSDFGRAIELAAEVPAYFHARGLIHNRLGNSSQALADYSRAIRLDPNYSPAMSDRAWLRFHRAEWAAAIADGRRTIELTPTAADAMRLVGYAHFAQGDYAAAVEILDQAIAADKTTGGAAFAMFIRHFAKLRLNQPDRLVATSWGHWSDEPWTQSIGRFIAGQVDEEQIEAAARDTKEETTLSDRLCEMHFYIGLSRLQAGDKSTARLRFEASRATKATTFIEYTLAQAELKRL